MPRYEFREGKSAKFWEIERDGESVTTRWGRIGTDGQTKTKDFDSVGDALKEVEKKTNEKTRKGYALVGGDAPAEGGASNPELEAAVLADRDDSAAALVYADWLEEQGDPRGRLITLMARSEDAEAEAWLAEHEEAILGALAPLTKIKTDGKWGPQRTAADLTWKLGLVESAWIGNVDWENTIDGPETIGNLFASPAGRFVRGLTIGNLADDGELEYDDVVAALAAAPRPTLEELFIGDFESEEMEISWSRIGEITALWKALPNLKSLRIRVGDITLGPIKHDALRELRINSGGLGSEPIERVCKAKLPKLERLELWLGTEDYGGEGDVEAIRPLLDARGPAKTVTHLGLANSEFADEIAAALPGAKVLKQLTSLDLSMGTMTDEGARAIYAAREQFAHLEWIDFAENFIADGDLIANLRGLCADVRGLDDQEDADEDWRYCSVAE